MNVHPHSFMKPYIFQKEHNFLGVYYSIKGRYSVCSEGFLMASDQYFISSGPVRKTEKTEGI